MKFTVSKKLSDNATLRIILIWMLCSLVAVMGISLAAKSIDYGTTPEQWQSTVLGNETKFVDPLTLDDLLLRVHTDLFSLILIFVLMASLMMRTSYSSTVKRFFLIVSLGGLVFYPVFLLGSSWLGGSAVIIAGGSFILFNGIMLVSAGLILVSLIRHRI